MQFNTTLLKVAALFSLVATESELCAGDHSGRNQHCTIQFKTDAESLGKFAEVYEHLKGLKCSWIGADDIHVTPESGLVNSNLPAGFTDAVFAKLPQYAPYIASKTCD